MFQWAGIIFSVCNSYREAKHFMKRGHLRSKQATKKGLDLASGFEQIPEPVHSWLRQHE